MNPWDSQYDDPVYAAVDESFPAPAPASAPASAPVINITCSGGAAADSGPFSGLLGEADKYLTEGVKPFEGIPLFVWVALVAAGAWYFWGRHHYKEWGLGL